MHDICSDFHSLIRYNISFPLEVSSAFFYDLLTFVGKVAGSLINANQWNRMTYVDCFDFKSTDPVALEQALRMTSYMHSVSIV